MFGNDSGERVSRAAERNYVGALARSDCESVSLGRAADRQGARRVSGGKRARTRDTHVADRFLPSR